MRYEILFLYLYLGHLIGDVFLQTRSLSKNKSRFFSNQLLHSAVVTFVTMVVYLALDPLFWLVYAIIFVGHTIIDEIKCKLDPDNSSLSLLIIDQIVHFVFLAVLVFSIYIEQKTLYTSYSTPYFEQLMSPGFVRVAIIVSGLILCVPFGGEIVQKSIAKYVDINSSGEKRKLSKSDAIIASMERILIFNFILTANIILVPALLIAKAIFEHIRNRQSPEKADIDSITLGTFISYGWATTVAVVINSLI